MNKDKLAAMYVASGAFLIQHLPDGWENWEEEELDNFIVENAWEPFQHWIADDIYDQIECLADTIVAQFTRK